MPCELSSGLAMSSRPRRDATLKNVESLILAQAVWEHGNAWPIVARILSKHPLISRPKSFFTAQSSHVMYENLMREAGLEPTEASNAIHSPVNRKLAEKFYRARVEELRELVITEETKFKAILMDMEAIRSGNFDAQITARITGTLVDAEHNPTSVALPSADEDIGGLGLSGATAAATSPSQQRQTPLQTSDISHNQPLPAVPQSEQTAIFEAPSQIPSTVDAGSSPRRYPADTGMIQAMGAPDEYTDNSNTYGSSEATVNTTPVISTLEPYQSLMEHCITTVEENEKREEEEEEEDVALAVGSETPRAKEGAEEEEEEDEDESLKAVVSTETPTSEGDTTSIQQEIPTDSAPYPSMAENAIAESPALLDVEVELALDDGETSGEEPLHASRRSTRRRRSTLSPAQPLQTRGKARRQRVENPAAKVNEDLEPDEMEGADTQDGTTMVDMEDVSPTPVDTLHRREGKRKASFAEGAEAQNRKRARDDSEPVDDDEAGTSSHTLRGRRQVARSDEQKRFQNVIQMLHAQISQHRNGNIFHNPIKNSEAPDYREIVKRPMDLKTIKMKVKDGSISNSVEYERDIFLMFANAMMYNRPGSDVHTMAEDVSGMLSAKSRLANQIW
ncbi:hypothetical protein H0H81_004800 [Sphagnurus paluster]|uniref:Bromo domain-containing protein n=1 Tax=Sphagnurus paluster TaxID=117069 RepID=A0A9P7FY60_9AGAR|nr:hypothetical protein H0H81_004800 [Sphagnurus paluster]